MCCILVPCALPVSVELSSYCSPNTEQKSWFILLDSISLAYLFRRLAVSKASDMGTLFFITLFSSSDSWLPDTLASPCHRQGTTQTLSPAAIQVTPSRCWNAELLLWRVQSKEQQRHTHWRPPTQCKWLTKKSYRWLIEFYKAGKSKSTQGTVSAVFKLRPEEWRIQLKPGSKTKVTATTSRNSV